MMHCDELLDVHFDIETFVTISGFHGVDMGSTHLETFSYILLA